MPPKQPHCDHHLDAAVSRLGMLKAREQRDAVMDAAWRMAAAIEQLDIDPYCPRETQPTPTPDDPGPMPRCGCGVHDARDYARRYQAVRARVLAEIGPQEATP